LTNGIGLSRAHTFDVIAGLDPAIHLSGNAFCEA